MNDRIPGTTYDNPIWYRNYRIYLNDYGPYTCTYTYAHDSYDGAEDAYDNRCGYGATIEECKAEIDSKEDD